MPETETSRLTPLRLRKGMEAFTSLMVGKIKVSGRENLESLPPDLPVIIAVTHINDLEFSIAVKALANDFNLVIADISKHRNFKEDPFTFIALTLAGRDNFLPLNYGREGGRWSASPFDPQDFDLISEAQKRGKTVIIAAHNPSSALRVRGGEHQREDEQKTYQLPETGGLGAVYLASKTNSLILPVAVNVEASGNIGRVGIVAGIETLLYRPNASVTIGQPMDLRGVYVSVIEKVGRKRDLREKITEQERADFRHAGDELRVRSAILMRTLASMLPPEKRGKW